MGTQRTDNAGQDIGQQGISRQIKIKKGMSGRRNRLGGGVGSGGGGLWGGGVEVGGVCGGGGVCNRKDVANGESCVTRVSERL
jgi:hypothetical protein